MLRALTRAFLSGLICCVSLVPVQAQVLEQDVPWQNMQDWNIYQSRVYKGCVAMARYQDGTTVRLGYDGITRGYFVNFSNPRWTGYEMLKNNELQFVRWIAQLQRLFPYDRA